ncbi:sulfite exporter TauE/SafE family protein [Pseudodesulfovibrio tunisiensis]|uniref:sulfite exporter TauE/SafE family protein n=1 Tax=Pseudodesulfovibrio tunisiensis TaxID=463192 RepID=UPI001FB537C4|nr:sulfite exporter TauE/SafE family protein [Pseudodesulfovibrio tunisiensis]
MLTTIILYVALGGVAGILAGLLGIGGGLVIVPMLAFAFPAQGFAHEHIQHLALGTSLATIIFTSMSSVRAHHSRGAVDWKTFWRITPGIITGTYLGSVIAGSLSTNFLKGFFAIFLYFVAANMLLGAKPKGSRQLPGTAGIFGVGNGIGIFSALVGIGGGTLSVPFLSWCNVAMHTAIGTAAAIGLPIAISGTIGYIVSGWNATNLPDYTIGYIYLPALLGIIVTSTLTAPLGARLAHSLPVGKLKKIFAILLLVVATRMLISIF